MCFQDVPTHVTILSMLMIAFDRYSFLKNPTRTRLPGFIFSTGTWLTAICVVLPYPIYTTYIDLGVSTRSFNFKQDLANCFRFKGISSFIAMINYGIGNWIRGNLCSFKRVHFLGKMGKNRQLKCLTFENLNG